MKDNIFKAAVCFILTCILATALMIFLPPTNASIFIFLVVLAFGIITTMYFLEKEIE